MADQHSSALADAAEHIAADFGGARIERGVLALERRIARRRAVRRGLTGAAGCALLALGLWWSRADTARPSPTQVAGVSLLETSDGSRAHSLSQESELRVERDAREEVALRLVRGKGHFEVTPNRARRYRVRAGDVEVEVLGTAFVVERVQQRARVRVEHGVVKVVWREGSLLLHAGDQGLFPPLPAAASAQGTEPSAVQATETSSAAAAASSPELAANLPERGTERWRTLARAGKHQEAFGSLGKKPVDDLSGLLLAADAARLSGHPREAVGYLEQLIARYPHSASAHLSAFTLGRLALYELDEPALAAKSFARAYALNARGPLAEDALAREAEAYHRAGDAERAKRAAERYLERYPAGARRAELQKVMDHLPAAGP